MGSLSPLVAMQQPQPELRHGQELGSRAVLWSGHSAVSVGPQVWLQQFPHLLNVFHPPMYSHHYLGFG